MASPLRLEEIYDASTDGACFEQLSARLAGALGARSAVVHWRGLEAGECEEEVSYSGHFSAEHMAQFADHFADDDLWSNAIRSPGAVNKVWDCDLVVPPSVYENSRIYNEWIRPMGDDSFHALGAALRTTTAIAEIGFHRGRGQGGFAPAAVARLGHYLGHIARAIEIRARLTGASARVGAAAVSLDILETALFSLTDGARVLHHNAAADALIERGDVLRIACSRLVAVQPRDRSSLALAIERAGSARASLPAAFRIASSAGRDYNVTVVSAPSQIGRRIVVAVQDPSLRDPSLAERARGLWGLSAAEAEIAIRLSQGASPAAIADERRTALDTIRTQIKSLGAKMGVRRQAEVVAALNSLPPLRAPAGRT